MWKETLAEPNHPIWKAFRLLIIGVIIAVYCATQYKNPINATDIGLIVAALAGVGSFDQVKDRVVKMLRTK